ncbi:DNA cytosine methyltransferase [Microbulbifer sp. CnH-101-G]|uniref:DNA cytosine methyltransferase n=1 Tax=Microbulbifer sp. CnH-101-G TaxID=3243393 RepID=UPI004039C1C9
MKMKFVDYCAGIGGFRLPLEKLGLECVHTCELDSDCIKTYNQNYNESLHVSDLLSLNIKDIPDFDLLCSGFPCQPFSIAGKQKGLSDSRGNIILKIIEICKEKKPSVVFLENVANFVRHDKGSTFKRVIKEFNSLGYTLYSEVLNSSVFGVPQNRKRVYIVAFRQDINSFNFSFPTGHTLPTPLRSFLEPKDYSIPISKKWNEYIDLYTNKIDIDQVSFEVPKTRKKLERKDKDVNLEECIFQMRSSGIRALSIDKPLPTLAVSVSGGGAMIPVYSKERRHLSLLEMKRIMGFPDGFEFPVSRTSAVKQLANAVCPPVIEAIANSIIETLKLTNSRG